MDDTGNRFKNSCWQLVSSMGQQGISRAAIRQLLLEDGISEEEAEETLDRFEKTRRKEVAHAKSGGCLMIFLPLVLVLLVGPVWGGILGGATLLGGAVSLLNGISGAKKLRSFRGRNVSRANKDTTSECS